MFIPAQFALASGLRFSRLRLFLIWSDNARQGGQTSGPDFTYMAANTGYVCSLIDLSVYAFLYATILFILRSTPIDQKMGAKWAFLPLLQCAIRSITICLVYNDSDDLVQSSHFVLDLVAQCKCNARI